MHIRVPSLEDVCCTSILQFSKTTRCVLRTVLPRRLRAGLVRRVILEGKVTSMATALATWPDSALVVGELCCMDPILFGHGSGPDASMLVQQVLANSMDRPPPSHPRLPQQALPVPFICARFLELLVSERHAPLRHLDLSFYSLVSLPDLVPIIDALEAIYDQDMRDGRQCNEQWSLSVSVLYSPVSSSRRTLHASVERLAHLLELQGLRRTRCRLLIAGLHSEVCGEQKMPRRLLQLLAHHRCPLRLLIAYGPSEWLSADQLAPLASFPELQLLGAGACGWMMSARASAADGARLPEQPAARALSLVGCSATVARRLAAACRPAGQLRSLTVSADLVSVLAPAELAGLRQLTVGVGHGPPARRAGQVDQLLRTLSGLRALELLFLEDPLSPEQTGLLAAALPVLSALRFVRLPAAGLERHSPDAPEILRHLQELAAAARRLPELSGLHVSLMRQQTAADAADDDELESYNNFLLEVADHLRHQLGPPVCDDVYLYLTDVYVGMQGTIQMVPL